MALSTGNKLLVEGIEDRNAIACLMEAHVVWGDGRDTYVAFPPEGLVEQNAEGKRLGIWIMPDNRSRGMIGTFLQFLVPTASADLWSYAREAILTARGRGATYRDAHADKASMHTWLAWQNPPGQSFGNALLTKCLDPHSKRAAAFVHWFKRLYDI